MNIMMADRVVSQFFQNALDLISAISKQETGHPCLSGRFSNHLQGVPIPLMPKKKSGTNTKHSIQCPSSRKKGTFRVAISHRNLVLTPAKLRKAKRGEQTGVWVPNQSHMAMLAWGHRQAKRKSPARQHKKMNRSP
jgi:hypothetical protein